MPPAIPGRVQRALDLAAELRFELSCSLEVGRLLRVLAAQVNRGIIGEIGTGCGVGSAWLLSGMRAGASLVTVELEAVRAKRAGALFQDDPRVRVLHADWHVLLSLGPFALLFADGARAKQTEPEALLEALGPGGLLILDDFTTPDPWPAERRGPPDPVRDFWLSDPRVASTEVQISPRAVPPKGNAVLLMVRTGP